MDIIQPNDPTVIAWYWPPISEDANTREDYCIVLNCKHSCPQPSVKMSPSWTATRPRPMPAFMCIACMRSCTRFDTSHTDSINVIQQVTTQKRITRLPLWYRHSPPQYLINSTCQSQMTSQPKISSVSYNTFLFPQYMYSSSYLDYDRGICSTPVAQNDRSSSFLHKTAIKRRLQCRL